MSKPKNRDLNTAVIAAQLLKYVRDFIDKQDITCEETITQSDNIILNAHEFIAQCCEIVGYKEIKDE